MVRFFSLLCLSALVVFHYVLHDYLERPAKKAAGSRIVGLSDKELLRLKIIAYIPLFLLLPAVFGFFISSLRNILVVLSFFGIWLYQILHIWAIKNLQKVL